MKQSKIIDTLETYQYRNRDAVVPHGVRSESSTGSEHNRDNEAVLRLIKSTTGQHIKYNLYALLLSYILLLHRFGLKSQEQLASPQNLKATRRTRKREGLGRNLVPWQEGVVGNDPTGRNPRRAAGDGDPARTSGAVLERERERRSGERDEWVWGS